MGRKFAVSFLLVALLALAGTVHAAPSTYLSPESFSGYGTQVIQTEDLGFIDSNWGGGAGYLTGAGSVFTLHCAAGGSENVAYYAFQVPAGAAVSITGGQWKGTDSSWGQWGETMLFSSSDLSLSTASLNPMMSADFGDGGAWDGKTVADRWNSGSELGAYASGYNAVIYDSTSTKDEFTYVWNYAANAQHFATVGGTGTDPVLPSQAKNPFDPSIRGGNDSALPANMPANYNDISNYTYTGNGALNRIMQETEAPAAGLPSWVVTANTGTWQEVALIVKVGGGPDASLTVSGLEFEVRGPGDSNGDGYANATDLNTVLSFYNQAGGWTEGDFNGDGLVNATDLNTVLSYYNTNYNGALNLSTVPEPSTICLVLNGFAMLLGYWLRKR